MLCRYNKMSPSPDLLAWDAADAILRVGSGTSPTELSDALRVIKSCITQLKALEVEGTLAVRGSLQTDNRTASGRLASATGDRTIASGLVSTATGSITTASGAFSTAMGDSTTASGAFSTATGDRTVASGLVSRPRLHRHGKP